MQPTKKRFSLSFLFSNRSMPRQNIIYFVPTIKMSQGIPKVIHGNLDVCRGGAVRYITTLFLGKPLGVSLPVFSALSFASTVKFLNFPTPENFAVINLKFKQRSQTAAYFVKKMQIE